MRYVLAYVSADVDGASNCVIVYSNPCILSALLLSLNDLKGPCNREIQRDLI
jgi:hypothetical protein